MYGIFFDSSEHEVHYQDLPLAPLLFQDDIARLSLSVQSAQFGNDIMRSVAESKLLDFNIEKSGFVIFASKRRRPEVLNELKVQPLELCNKKMKHMSSVKYLGDYLNEKGLAESVHVTVLKRKGLVTKAIYDIKSVINDCRTHVTGKLISGIDLWETAVIPMLLYNSETWQDIKKATIEELEKLQVIFLRSLFAVGSGCPLPLLYSQTGTLRMEFRILEKKLTFLHHLEHLPDSALAKEVLKIQTEEGLPGIYNECREFLAHFKIFDLKQYSKQQFKKLVRAKIKVMNKNRILEEAKSKNYKKIEFSKLASDNFELKEYLKNFSVEDARLNFKIKSYMTPGVKMNFQSDKLFTRELWACEECRRETKLGLRDTQEHVLICPAYESLRLDKDLDNDLDLVVYFRSVLQLRAK